MQKYITNFPYFQPQYLFNDVQIVILLLKRAVSTLWNLIKAWFINCLFTSPQNHITVYGFCDRKVHNSDLVWVGDGSKHCITGPCCIWNSPMFELVRFWERELRTQRRTLLRLAVHARFVSTSHVTHDSLEEGTSRSEAQGSNQYLHVCNTYKEGGSFRCGWCCAPGTTGTAALKEAEVNGCSCCCTVRTLGNIWRDKITKNFTPMQIYKYSLDDLVFCSSKRGRCYFIQFDLYRLL